MVTRLIGFRAGAAIALAALFLLGTGTTSQAATASDACQQSTHAIALGITTACTVTESGAEAGLVTHSATVDLTGSGVTPFVVQSNSVIFQPLAPAAPPQSPYSNETVSHMADRTHAVLGINGGYFDNNKGPTYDKPDQSYSGVICGGLVQDGRIVKSPPSKLQLSASLAVHMDGSMSIGHPTFDGSITAGQHRIALDSINTLADAAPEPSCPKELAPGPTAGNGVTMLTSDFGDATLIDKPTPDGNSRYAIHDAVEVFAHDTGSDSYVIDAIEHPAVISHIDALAAGHVILLATSSNRVLDSKQWIDTNLAVDQSIEVSQALSDPTIVSLIGGVAQLVESSAPIATPDGYLPTLTHRRAETVLGLSADGRQVSIMVFDQIDASPGVTWLQAQALLVDQHIDSAILFDGGGSSTLVGQLGPPSAEGVTVLNNLTGDSDYPIGPSNQRYVGDGLFFTGLPPSPGPTPIPTATPVAAPALAESGSELPPTMGLAGALLVLGAATVLVTRLRRRRIRAHTG